MHSSSHSSTELRKTQFFLVVSLSALVLLYLIQLPKKNYKFSVPHIALPFHAFVSFIKINSKKQVIMKNVDS